MKLSLDVLIEKISDRVVQTPDIDPASVRFLGVRVVSQQDTSLDPDYLYICAPSVLYRVGSAFFHDVFVVVRTCPEEYRPEKAIVLDEDVDMRVVTNCLIDLFDQINHLELSVKELIIEGSSYQPFFDLARELFPECLIVMTDSAYNLVCKTMEKTGNEYLDGILARGFYSKHDMDLISAYGYFEDERKYFKPILYPADQTISGFPYLVRSFRRYGATFSFVGCYFLNHKATLLSLTMFQCLTDGIGRYMDHNGLHAEEFPRNQQLVDDLINGKDGTDVFLSDRCTRLKIPFEGKFRLGVIQTEADNNIKAAQMANQLKIYCTVRNYGIFQYNTKIVILFQDWYGQDVKYQVDFEDAWQAFIRTLSSGHASLGLSIVFHSVRQFGAAYHQALAALNCGGPLKPGAVYHYSTYCIHDMLETYGKTMPLETVYTKYLDELDDVKPTSGLSNLALLYVYLALERNVAQTAKCVHMHRNGVLYRIEKIRDRLKLDLNSPEVRFRLLLSYKTLEHLGRIDLSEFILQEDDIPSESFIE